MARNKISDLRDHLFAQIEALREAAPEKLEREISRAKAVCTVSEQLIESAKVEVHMVEALGGTKPTTAFLAVADQEGRELPKKYLNGGAPS